jgi:signal transduction histidine kinase
MPDSSRPLLPADLPPATGLLQTILDTSPNGIMLLRPVYDAAGTTIVDLAWAYLNPAAQLQLQLSEHPAGSFRTLFPTAEAAGVFGFYREAFLSGEVKRRQNNYQHDGLDGYYLLVAQREGDVLVVNFTDTNDQNRTAMEQELRASQARELEARAETELQSRQLEQMLHDAPAMICVFDGPQHVFQFVNPPYQAMMGNRLLIGKPIAEAMPELVGQPIFDWLDGVYRTGETLHSSEMLVQLDHANDGRPELDKRYYTFINQARHNQQGAVNGIFVFGYDVTAQVLARQQVQALNEELQASNKEFLTTNAALAASQQALHTLNQELESRVAARTQEGHAARAEAEQQRAQLQRVFEQAPVAICVFRGPEYVLEIVNPPMALMLGRPLGALVDHPFFVAVPEMQSQGLRTLLDEVRQTRVPFVAQEQPIHLAHYSAGAVGYFNFVYQPLHNAEGQAAGVICIATEVTEQVLARQRVLELNEELAIINEEMLAANEELRNTNNRLSHTNVDLDTFVYTASHDLKAPIANIEGLLLALGEQLPPTVRHNADITHLLELMSASVARFQRTLGHLTDVSMLQQAPTEPAEAVDLLALAETVQLDLAPALASTGGRLVLDLAACPTVRFSPKNLRSIRYNLLSNGIKYHAPGRAPLVVLRASCTAGQVQLEVQDNGLGLSEEQQGKLFVMFRRLHTHVEGTGVGLYMVRRIVENAGGSIQVESQPGVGSTFRVRLPMPG